MEFIAECVAQYTKNFAKGDIGDSTKKVIFIWICGMKTSICLSPNNVAGALGVLA